MNCGATRVAQAGDGKNKTVAGTGNLYQWGRYEATNHGGPAANGPIDNARPGNTFYTVSNSPHNWLNRVDNSLWNGSSKGPNDPCPPEYRVPTDTELMSIGNATSWDGSGGLFKVNVENSYPQLILPAAGCREVNGSSSNPGIDGYYWSSSVSSDPNIAFFNSATLRQIPYVRARGFPVRCIREYR